VVAFHFLLNCDSTLTIAQNDDDARLFIDQVSVDPRRITIIRGSGVDLEQFKPLVIPRTPDVPVAVCVSRMLWDKGIDELVAAARLLKSRGVVLKIRLVGPDDDNPAAISQDQLDVWAAEGIVDIAGPSDDIPGVYADADIAVLPSYREGLPESLQEAAAGLPLVATDVPGCREICRDEDIGLLIPLKSVEPLADALECLAKNPDLRAKFGAAARTAAEKDFSEARVVADTLALYDQLATNFVEHR